MTVTSFAQKRKFFFPAWTFHEKNATILGVSAGLWSMGDNIKQTNTIGLRLEVPGAGILMGFIPSSPLAETDSAASIRIKQPVTEKVYGISLSSLGTLCNCNVNGISVGIVGQLHNRMNGISFSAINFAQTHNGIMIGTYNQAYRMNGVQIGFVNRSSRTRGVQIGILNQNEKRKMPIINWNF